MPVYIRMCILFSALCAMSCQSTSAITRQQKREKVINAIAKLKEYEKNSTNDVDVVGPLKMEIIIATRKWGTDEKAIEMSEAERQAVLSVLKNKIIGDVSNISFFEGNRAIVRTVDNARRGYATGMRYYLIKDKKWELVDEIRWLE